MASKKPKPLTPSEREEYEERAAIIQYDGKVSREEAERQALDIVMRRRSK